MRVPYASRVGQVFGRLTVTGLRRIRPGHILFVCECSCGRLCEVTASDVLSGHTSSCGCLRQEAREYSETYYSELVTWRSMRNRCLNPGCGKYPSYGGRGICICPSWASFRVFVGDMGPKPSKSHTLDRIDNDGPYCKENCRWATRKEQQNNTRGNHLLTLDGVTRTTAEWADFLGVNVGTLRARICRGWSDAAVLTTPVTSRSRRLTC